MNAFDEVPGRSLGAFIDEEDSRNGLSMNRVRSDRVAS